MDRKKGNTEAQRTRRGGSQPSLELCALRDSVFQKRILEGIGRRETQRHRGHGEGGVSSLWNSVLSVTPCFKKRILGGIGRRETQRHRGHGEGGEGSEEGKHKGTEDTERGESVVYGTLWSP